MRTNTVRTIRRNLRRPFGVRVAGIAATNFLQKFTVRVQGIKRYFLVTHVEVFYRVRHTGRIVKGGKNAYDEVNEPQGAVPIRGFQSMGP